jgi:hypothetical protein
LTYSYIVAGMTVRSEIALPELVPYSLESNEPDIEISFAHVPEKLPQSTAASSQAEIADNEVLLKVPDVARYHVKAKNEDTHELSLKEAAKPASATEFPPDNRCPGSRLLLVHSERPGRDFQNRPQFENNLPDSKTH